MANPQVENGYIMIATELLEALCRIKLSGNEFRLLLLIIRNTYGYHCKSAPMSLSELSAVTGIDKSHISRTLKNLRRLNMIEVLPSQGMQKQIISLQKNYEQWGRDLNIAGVSDEATVAKSGNNVVAKDGNATVAKSGNDYIYNIYNKNNNKDNNKNNKNKKSSKDNSKKIYGEYKHVRLTDNQYSKLVDDYGETVVKDYIKRLDEYIQMKGAKYKDHNLTIRHWLNNANVLKLSDKPQGKNYYGEDDTF